MPREHRIASQLFVITVNDAIVQRLADRLYNYFDMGLMSEAEFLSRSLLAKLRGDGDES